MTRHKRLQAFSRDKLFISIIEVMKHRQSALEDATDITDTVLQRLLKNSSAEITTHSIITITQQTLLRFDKTAAAVYNATYSSRS